MITFKQYLIEAREDLIAQQQEQQILMAYKRKDLTSKWRIYQK